MDLVATIRASGRLIERVIGEYIRMVYRLRERTPPAYLDPNVFEHIMLNLALNARDAMPSGGTLSVGVELEHIDQVTALGLAMAYDTDSDVEPVDEPAKEESSSNVTGRILLVEDDPAVRNTLARVLEKGGFEVLEATNAESELAILLSGKTADLVLSDLVLPEMSGLDLLERIREFHPNVPIGVMSGHAEGSPGRQEGIPTDVAFVHKPFMVERIMGVVRSQLHPG